MKKILFSLIIIYVAGLGSINGHEVKMNAATYDFKVLVRYNYDPVKNAFVSIYKFVPDGDEKYAFSGKTNKKGILRVSVSSSGEYYCYVKCVVDGKSINEKYNMGIYRSGMTLTIDLE